MYCKNCGTQISDDTKFCPKCGIPIDAAIPVPLTSQPALQRPSYTKPVTSKKTIVTILIFLVLLFSASTALIIHFTNNRTAPEAPSQNVQVQYQPEETTPVITPESVPTSSSPIEITPEPEEEKPIPVALVDLDCTSKGLGVEVGYDSNDFAKDVDGNTYSYDEVICLFSGWKSHVKEEKSRLIKYYVGKDYSILSGVIYRPYITLSCDSTWDTDGRVKIYGDGALIFSESISQDDFEPISFSTDISGIREIEIELEGYWKGSSNGATFFYPKLCIAELQVVKD
ncbi:MAG: zinc-ribbon domain-containing protein, partial [Clostridia bacterium]|nr:zinc-ribbon domain-containing protein [Clostridia bacterium]